MNGNRISHLSTRIKTPPRPPAFASPYVQRVDLNTDGRLIVTSAEDSGCTPKCRGQTESGVSRYANEHPAHLGFALRSRRPPRSRWEFDGSEHVGIRRQLRRLEESGHRGPASVDGGDVRRGRQ